MELRRFLMSAPKPGLRADPGTRFQPVPFDEVGGKSGGSNGLLHDLANPNDSPGPFSPGGPSTPENEDGVMSGNPASSAPGRTGPTSEASSAATPPTRTTRPDRESGRQRLVGS